MGIAIFHTETSIFILLIGRDFILKSYFYYTGHVLYISHVIFYHVAILLLLIMLIIRKKKVYSFDLFNSTFVLLSLYLLFSTFVLSSFRGYGVEKLFYFSLTLLACFGFASLITKTKSVKYFAYASFFQSLFLVLVSLVSDFDYKLFNGIISTSRFSILGINPIWVSRLLFYGLLSNLYLFRTNKNVLLRIGVIVISVLQFYYGFLTNSRGPLLALILGIIVYSLFSIKKISMGKVMVILLVFALMIGVGYNKIKNNPNSRFSGAGTGDTSTQSRLFAQYQAYTLFSTNIIFGGGWGSFSQYPLEYPHNVFTEIGSETGLIGLAIFLSLLIITLSRILSLHKHHNNHETCFLMALLASSFINANLSGHVGLNPFFWLSLYLVNHYYLISKREENIAFSSQETITYQERV